MIIKESELRNIIRLQIIKETNYNLYNFSKYENDLLEEGFKELSQRTKEFGKKLFSLVKKKTTGASAIGLISAGLLFNCIGTNDMTADRAYKAASSWRYDLTPKERNEAINFILRLNLKGLDSTDKIDDVIQHLPDVFDDTVVGFDGATDDDIKRLQDAWNNLSNQDIEEEMLKIANEGAPMSEPVVEWFADATGVYIDPYDLEF